MASNNPNQQQYQAYNSNPYEQQGQNPWSSEPSQNPSETPYNQTHQQQAPTQNQAYQQNPSQGTYPPQQGYPTQDEPPPGLPPRRTATDMALPTGQDRSHQIEVLQSYEAAGRKTEADADVEILQREFPKIDGSLIAAIYGDSGSLSATREMLQALGDD